MQLHTPVTKFLLILLVMAGLCLPSMAKVIVNEGNGVDIVMENDALKINIAVEAGGRVSEFVNKKNGKNLVALWKGLREDGGLLDDRNVFTSFHYRGVVTQPGGAVGSVRLVANHPDGMSIVKTFTLREGQSILEMEETFSNGTQQPARFMLRNFMLPGGGPQTEANQYFLPLRGGALQPQSLPNAPNGWIENLEAPWSALWNSQTGEGILVAAPGVEKFYFWQSSRIFPSYEWKYPDVAAGKSITVNYALQIVNDMAPNWPLLSAAALKGLKPVRFENIPGWQNEEQRFKVTTAEKKQGFWFSVGNGKNKRRLPEKLALDVPLNEARSAYIAFNALQDLKNADMQVRLKGIAEGLVQTGWEITGKGYREVAPFSGSTSIQLTHGTEGRLWLTLRGGSEPVEATGELVISLNGQQSSLPLAVKVWPVQVTEKRPFGVRGYGDFATLAGGIDITEQTLQQTDAMLDYFQAIGGNVLDLAGTSRMYRNLKIAGTNQTLTSWFRQDWKAFVEKPVAEWPQIDFSYYDPWIKLAQAHGLTGASTFLGNETAKGSTPQRDEWVLSRLKTWLQAHGIREFYCQIGDENASDEIPHYIEQAKIAQRAGWNLATTITGQIARNADNITQMNPYLDRWVVGIGSTLFFNEVLNQKYEVQEKSVVLPTKSWKSYNNGGARNTIAQEVFNSLVPDAADKLEHVEILQDGRALQRVGTSPWGNQKPGVFFVGLSNYVYLAPHEGTTADQSQFTMRYQVRVPAEGGEKLARLDPTDDIWFYGGGSNSYNTPYEDTILYPLKALQGSYAGFCFYAFHRWDNDKVLWYDQPTGKVRISPAYLGLKNGWDDACLLAWLDKNKNVPISRFIAERTDAPLRIGEVKLEIYRWRNVVNLTDPFMLNDVRRQMLAAAAG